LVFILGSSGKSDSGFQVDIAAESWNSLIWLELEDQMPVNRRWCCQGIKWSAITSEAVGFPGFGCREWQPEHGMLGTVDKLDMP